MSSDFLGFDFLSAVMNPTPEVRRGYTADATAMPDLRRGYTTDATAMPDIRRGYTAGAAMSVDPAPTQGIVGTHLLSSGS